MSKDKNVEEIAVAAPRRIFLQWQDDNHQAESVITWCEDEINESDEEYIHVEEANAYRNNSKSALHRAEQAEKRVLELEERVRELENWNTTVDDPIRNL